MPAKKKQKKLRYKWELEDFVGEALLTAKKLPLGRPETPAEKGLGTFWSVAAGRQARPGQRRCSQLLL
jgi:hypothetical protein